MVDPYFPDPLADFNKHYGIAPRKKGRPKRDIYNPLVDEPEQQNVLRDIGGAATGGLSMFASALDLPGSVVRDVLSLGGNAPQNPFDQLLTPFSPDNRTSGRDLMRGYGMVGNQDNWGNFATGLAAEIALDPLTWMTLGGSAVLTGAGKAAKATTGLAKGIGNQIRAGERGLLALAAPFSEKGIQVGTGKTAAKIGDAMSSAADAMRFGNIPGTSYSPGRHFSAVFNQAARGVSDAVVQPWALGPVKEATEAGRMQAGMTLGEAVQPLKQSGLDWTDPVINTKARSVWEHRPWATTDDWKNLSQDQAGFTAGQQLTDTQNTALMSHLDTAFPEGAGWSDDAVADEMGRWMIDNGLTNAGVPRTRSMTKQWMREHGDILGDLPTMEAIGKIQPRQSQLLRESQAIGLEKHALEDDSVKYATRHTAKVDDGYGTGGGAGSNARDFSGKRAEDIGREDFIKNIRGGTATLAKVAKDEMVSRWIDDAVAWKLGPEHIAKLIAKRHTEFDAWRTTFTQSGDILRRNAPRASDTAEMESLTKFSDWLMTMPRPLREAGIFPNNPFFDAGNGLKNQEDALAIGKETLAFLARGKEAGILPHSTPTPDSIAMGELLDSLGMGLKSGGERVAIGEIRKLGGFADAALTAETRVDRKIASALQKYTDGFRSPQSVNVILNALDSYTNIWKLGVTGVWPAYHVRNMLSSQFQNVVAGNFSGRSVGNAWTMLHGRDVEDAAQIPVLRALLTASGRPVTSREATNLIRELASATDLVGRHEGFAGDLVGPAASMRPGTLNDVLGELPGTNPISLKGIGQEFAAKTPGTTWDPRKSTIRGFGGRTETTQAFVKGTESVGYLVEGMARLSPFIHKLRRLGVEAGGVPLTKQQLLKAVRDAADEVGTSQVKYGSRNFSPFEKNVLKRAIPFYSFSSRMMPWMLRELAEKPGGKLAQTMRASVAAKDPNEIMPEHIAETAAIPVDGGPLEALLGTPKDGGQRFIAGFGLAHEDPLSMFGKGVSGGLLEVLGRAHPLLKAPFQVATGQSFFQTGPMGGRPLEDLDPTIGRTIANFTEQENAVRYPFDRQVEGILETLPISRAASTLRTWSDPRKGIAAKAVNTLTGIRASDVSPHHQDTLIREKIKAFEKKHLGARTFETSYLPDYAKERLSPEQLEFAARIAAMKRELVRRQQVRKAEDQARKSAILRIP